MDERHNHGRQDRDVDRGTYSDTRQGDIHRKELGLTFNVRDQSSASHSSSAIHMPSNPSSEYQQNFKVTDEEKAGTIPGSKVVILVVLSYKLLQVNT